ncbi:hypothetical protein IRJ41_022824, partial [Triplophysa rosa]
GVLLGVPQYDITEMYSALTSRGRPTEASLQHILMTHPVYRTLLTDYLRFNGLTTADGNHNGIVNGKNKGFYNGHKTTNHLLK